MKFLKNKIYLTLAVGILLSIVGLLTIILTNNTSIFSIVFASNIFINFLVTGLCLVYNENISIFSKFKLIGSYLLITLFTLFMEVIYMNKTLDMNVYSNLMYITNIKMYLGIYSLFILVMIATSIYMIIKMKEKVNNSTKADKSNNLNTKKD